MRRDVITFEDMRTTAEDVQNLINGRIERDSKYPISELETLVEMVEPCKHRRKFFIELLWQTARVSNMVCTVTYRAYLNGKNPRMFFDWDYYMRRIARTPERKQEIVKQWYAPRLRLLSFIITDTLYAKNGWTFTQPKSTQGDGQYHTSHAITVMYETK